MRSRPMKLHRFVNLTVTFTETTLKWSQNTMLGKQQWLPTLTHFKPPKAETSQTVTQRLHSCHKQLQSKTVANMSCKVRHFYVDQGVFESSFGWIFEGFVNKKNSPAAFLLASSILADSDFLHSATDKIPSATFVWIQCKKKHTKYIF